MSNIPPLNIFITARLKLKNKPNYCNVSAANILYI